MNVESTPSWEALRGDRAEQQDQSSKPDPYDLARQFVVAKVEQLREVGQLQRISEISNEEEFDQHFDDLTALYRQACPDMALA